MYRTRVQKEMSVMMSPNPLSFGILMRVGYH